MKYKKLENTMYMLYTAKNRNEEKERIREFVRTHKRKN